MKEHNFSFESLLGGWYINNDVCDNLINLFNNNKDLQTRVNRESGTVYGPMSVLKKSYDITVKPHVSIQEVDDYKVELQKVLQIYKDRYKIDKWLYYFGIEALNIQYYPKTEGYFSLHCENTGHLNVKDRCLVFMTFLNDVDDGGTVFPIQKTIVPAKKGLTLIWPAYFTHPHRGQISKTKEKYIITGWYKFIYETT